MKSRARVALNLSDRASVLGIGQIVLQGDAAALRGNARIEAAYFGADV